jgi:cyanate lyase
VPPSRPSRPRRAQLITRHSRRPACTAVPASKCLESDCGRAGEFRKIAVSPQLSISVILNRRRSRLEGYTASKSGPSAFGVRCVHLPVTGINQCLSPLRNHFITAVNARSRQMKRADLTEKILDIKREKNWSWKHICREIGGYSDTLIVGALLGQMKLTKPQAGKAGDLFGLSKTEIVMLNEVPMRGQGVPMPPTDPLIYRFYELVMINGPAWKALIEEEFGDGIMSAIDFDMQMERLPNPKGDRVKITMSGKFLPYKYYGNTGNIPEYGFREE